MNKEPCVTVALEDLITYTLVLFMENLDELGYKQDNKDTINTWFLNLKEEDMYKISEKLLKIEERNNKEHAEQRRASINTN